MSEQQMIGCAGGCGKKTAAETVEKSGWSCLEITGRYRCGECGRDLVRAAGSAGTSPRSDVDNLPPRSIGALKQLPVRQPLHEKVKP